MNYQASGLLQPNENDLLKTLLGAKVQSLSTAVVKHFTSDATATTIGIHKTTSGYELTMIGRKSHITAIRELRTELAKDHKRGHHEYFVLLIPAMYHSYIAHYECGDLYLTGVIDHDHHQIEAGETHTGNDLLKELSKFAADYADFPGGAE